jgi:hypothetical protein
VRKFYSIPSNKKTLFLRNLEYKLLSYDFLSSQDLNEYRKYFAYEVINLLDKYEFSLEDVTHRGLENQYIGDSISIREEFEDKHI